MESNVKTIGIIVISLKSGGTERVAARLSVLWASMGFEVVFFTRHPPSANDFEHACSKRILLPQNERNADTLKTAILENEIDVVVYNGGWNSLHFNIEVDAIKSTECKLVFVMHHHFANWAFFFYNAGDFYKHDLLMKIDRMVCVNPVQALWWKNRGTAVSYIPNPKTFSVTEGGRYNHESQSLIWIGRPRDPGKCLDEAITIFACVKKKIEDAKLIILGDVDAEYQKQILKRLSTSQVNDGIVFGGYCSDISSHLQHASVHIMTSVVETAGMVIGEAAAYCIPTVMYELPVTTETDGNNGIIQIPNRDRKAFVETVITIFNDKEYSKKLSEAAKTWAKDNTEKNISKKWDSVFSSLCSNKNGLNESTIKGDDVSDFETIENYRRIIKEIYRSEEYFIIHHFWKLKLFSRLTNRIDFIRRKIAGRLTTFFDTIR